MTDALGFRKRFGVVLPSTNTVAAAEFDAMRPRGVTNHVSRMFIRDRLVKNDEDFLKLASDLRAAPMDAPVDAVMTCAPDSLIAAVAVESFWDGVEGGRLLRERLHRRSGVGVAIGSDACRAALGKFGNVKRLGVITPYWPAGDDQVRRFFVECGYEIVVMKGFKCDSLLRMAHIGEQTLRDAIDEINDPSVEAIVLVGANVAAARVAAAAEFWLDLPVIAFNTATYWRALRQIGIDDKIPGFGSLLEDY
jgi:maleate isomerase